MPEGSGLEQRLRRGAARRASRQGPAHTTEDPTWKSALPEDGLLQHGIATVVSSPVQHKPNHRTDKQPESVKTYDVDFMEGESALFDAQSETKKHVSTDRLSGKTTTETKHDAAALKDRERIAGRLLLNQTGMARGFLDPSFDSSKFESAIYSGQIVLSAHGGVNALADLAPDDVANRVNALMRNDTPMSTMVLFACQTGATDNSFITKLGRLLAMSGEPLTQAVQFYAPRGNINRAFGHMSVEMPDGDVTKESTQDHPIMLKDAWEGDEQAQRDNSREIEGLINDPSWYQAVTVRPYSDDSGIPMTVVEVSDETGAMKELYRGPPVVPRTADELRAMLGARDTLKELRAEVQPESETEDKDLTKRRRFTKDEAKQQDAALDHLQRTLGGEDGDLSKATDDDLLQAKRDMYQDAMAQLPGLVLELASVSLEEQDMSKLASVHVLRQRALAVGPDLGFADTDEYKWLNSELSDPRALFTRSKISDDPYSMKGKAGSLFTNSLIHEATGKAPPEDPSEAQDKVSELPSFLRSTRSDRKGSSRNMSRSNSERKITPQRTMGRTMSSANLRGRTQPKNNRPTTAKAKPKPTTSSSSKSSFMGSTKRDKKKSFRKKV